MHPRSPRCKCGLIIMLSSSNKAVGEINAHDKRRWEGVELVRGRQRLGICSGSRCPTSHWGSKRNEAGRREGGSEWERLTRRDERPQRSHVVMHSKSRNVFNLWRKYIIVFLEIFYRYTFQGTLYAAVVMDQRQLVFLSLYQLFTILCAALTPLHVRGDYWSPLFTPHF